MCWSATMPLPICRANWKAGWGANAHHLACWHCTLPMARNVRPAESGGLRGFGRGSVVSCGVRHLDWRRKSWRQFRVSSESPALHPVSVVLFSVAVVVALMGAAGEARPVLP